jgi:hypothetical protein
MENKDGKVIVFPDLNGCNCEDGRKNGLGVDFSLLK